MKFGKVYDLEGIDFTLPPDPSTNRQYFAEATPSESLRAFIGCTGWSMKEWVGKVYPKGTPVSHFLPHYGRQFNTIELNTTHYRIPSLDQIERWIQDTPADFRFCPKVPQSISHRTGMGVGGQALGNFCRAMDALHTRLGCIFIQLPPYFGWNKQLDLEAFLRGWPKHLPLAVEARHESWFSTDEHLAGLLDMLQAYQAYPVITDVAGRRDVLHMGVTGAVVMVRFVGNAHPLSDHQRVDSWIKRLAVWGNKGISDVYFFPHQPDNLLAPELSEYVVDQIQKHTSFVCRGPTLLDHDKGEQMRLF
ncbi:MAG: DUF72 domain-containing protein [Saprospiraceae bacterium]|nr:DUF72 domain-containing protein [Saprospiraceae bacterium]